MTQMVSANHAPPATVRDEFANRPVGGILKRTIDIILASVGILILLPLFLLCVLGVRLTSRGPILFRHNRIGFQGRTFGCLKFRTMQPDAAQRLEEHLQSDPAAMEEWRASHKLRNDPRVTPLGAIMRKTSLDELPQLLNVLAGEMSIVGPRPVTEDELPRYAGSAPLYMACKPGITGLWQVSGRSSSSYDERVKLDASYARSWTVAMDAKIVLMTIPVLLGSKDAY